MKPIKARPSKIGVSDYYVVRVACREHCAVSIIEKPADLDELLELWDSHRKEKAPLGVSVTAISEEQVSVYRERGLGCKCLIITEVNP